MNKTPEKSKSMADKLVEGSKRKSRSQILGRKEDQDRPGWSVGLVLPH